ncbi:WASH complex subunit washout [Cochliomyia hominivorax]
MFKVPIIPTDLRHEETITQAAYALDCLQNTITTIFGRIDKRIEENNNKVQELQERISRSQAKINSLQGTRKAIHIYAPARFPSTSVFKDIPQTFDFDQKQKVIENKSNKEYHIESKLDTNLPSLNEKLIFFHVRDQNNEKLTKENNLSRKRESIKQTQDLGNMPQDLRSVSSTLLFNTDCCVYDLDEGDMDTDAWRRAKLLRNKRQQQTNNQRNMGKQILEPAPYSLAHRRNEKLTPSGGLKYTPKLSEAPELDLPLDLPDLPGIADDLRYESQEAKQKIAPSLALVVENLPELKELLKENDNNKSYNITAQQSISSDITTIAPPPPPPPPLTTVIQTPAPPPPPPPPALQKTEILANKPTTTISSSTNDTRSELMAAIRKAGGIGKAALRQTAAAPLATHGSDVVDNTRSQNSLNKTNSNGNSQGGDLMADLHNKLLMRRKGISGTKDDSKNTGTSNAYTTNTPSGNPVISRLSALIPPPPVNAKNKSRNTATTSEEEEDDDSNDTDWVD